MKTYPTSVLDQLFSVYFIESRYPYEFALGIDQAIAKVLVFATHGFQHVLGARCDRIGQAEKGRRLGAVAIDSSTIAITIASAAESCGGSSILLLLLVGSELLCKSQR